MDRRLQKLYGLLLPLEEKDSSEGVLLLPMTDDLSLRVVRVYKRLGTQALPSATLIAE